MADYNYPQPPWQAINTSGQFDPSADTQPWAAPADGQGFNDKLTKALGTLGQAGRGQQSQEGGGGGGGSFASASSPTGSGRPPSLDALVQMLRKQYEALYPGGGGAAPKGLLGV